MKDFQPSRRDILSGSLKMGVSALVLGSTGFALTGCGGQDAPTAKADDVYDMWRQVRQGLRQSPDHTHGRAKALIEAGDVDAIFKFVRDEIRLVSSETRTAGFGNDRIWGKRAALRCGAGTAREKADILVDMLTQIGLDAQIVEKPRLSTEDIPISLYRDFEQPFAPAISERQLAVWQEQFGTPSEEKTIVEADDDDRQIRQITDKIRKALGEEQLGKILPYDLRYRQGGATPVVKFTGADGETVYADIIRPNSELGPYPHSDREYEASEPGETLPVTITISGATTDTPDEPFEIASGQWAAEDLAGRQLRIGFKPAAETLSFLASRMGDVRAFTPVLSVQNLDGEDMEEDTAQVIGESFSLEGDRISVDEAGRVSVNGEDIGGAEGSGLADRVASVEITPDPSLFPDMRMSVTARDADGDIVEGLTAADFNLTDEGEPSPKLLQASNNAPRILFLADNSLSMPRPYRGEGTKMVELADRVRELVKSIHPKAKVTLQATGSNLWEELIVASQSSYNLIVYATDGDLGGRRPNAGDLEQLAAGPRALVLNVEANMEYLRGRDRPNTFDEMAEATNGEAMDAPDDGPIEEIEQTITRLLGEVERPPYKLSYRALGAAQGTRTVSLEVGDTAAEADYEVPAETARSRKLARLELTVKLGNHIITRTLAGYDGTGEITERDLNSLQGAMFGTHMLAFEGGAPSMSTLLDDILTAKLGIETLDKQLVETPDDADALLTELEKGFPILPGELATLLARTGPLSGEDFAMAELGLNTVFYSAHPIMNSDEFIRRVDILPLSKAYVIADNHEKRLEVAFDRSLKRNFGEAALFEQSTVSMLDGLDLEWIGRWPFRRLEPPIDEARVAAWGGLIDQLRGHFRHPGASFIAPERGEAMALWAVDNGTGEIYGILPDGTGGGVTAESLQAQLTELDRVIAAINLLATAAGAAGAVSGIGGVALGIVAAYGQRLARLYAAVAMSIMLMDASGIAPAIRAAIAEMACEIAKSIFLGVFSSAGKVAGNAVNLFATIEGVAGVAGAETNTACPMRAVGG